MNEEDIISLHNIDFQQEEPESTYNSSDDEVDDEVWLVPDILNAKEEKFRAIVVHMPMKPQDPATTKQQVRPSPAMLSYANYQECIAEKELNKVVEIPNAEEVLAVEYVDDGYLLQKAKKLNIKIQHQKELELKKKQKLMQKALRPRTPPTPKPSFKERMAMLVSIRQKKEEAARIEAEKVRKAEEIEAEKLRIQNAMIRGIPLFTAIVGAYAKRLNLRRQKLKFEADIERRKRANKKLGKMLERHVSSYLVEKKEMTNKTAVFRKTLQFMINMRVVRKRFHLRRIIDFTRKAGELYAKRRVINQFLDKIKKCQRYVKSFLACNHARIILVSKLWQNLSHIIHRRILQQQKKALEASKKLTSKLKPAEEDDDKLARKRDEELSDRINKSKRRGTRLSMTMDIVHAQHRASMTNSDENSIRVASQVLRRESVQQGMKDGAFDSNMLNQLKLVQEQHHNQIRNATIAEDSDSDDSIQASPSSSPTQSRSRTASSMNEKDVGGSRGLASTQDVTNNQSSRSKAKATQSATTTTASTVPEPIDYAIERVKPMIRKLISHKRKLHIKRASGRAERSDNDKPVDEELALMMIRADSYSQISGQVLDIQLDSIKTSAEKAKEGAKKMLFLCLTNRLLGKTWSEIIQLEVEKSLGIDVKEENEELKEKEAEGKDEDESQDLIQMQMQMRM